MRATFGHEARVHDHGLLMLSGETEVMAPLLSETQSKGLPYHLENVFS
jgi:hypothetical protein